MKMNRKIKYVLALVLVSTLVSACTAPFGRRGDFYTTDAAMASHYPEVPYLSPTASYEERVEQLRAARMGFPNVW